MNKLTLYQELVKSDSMTLALSDTIDNYLRRLPLHHQVHTTNPMIPDLNRALRWIVKQNAVVVFTHSPRGKWAVVVNEEHALGVNPLCTLWAATIKAGLKYPKTVEVVEFTV